MKIKGMVLDIQRSSMHDGPGIRTTIFLKGCPLRCKWCHNPESQAFVAEIAYREEKCVHCGACVFTCSEGNHIMRGGMHEFLHHECGMCRKCISACSSGCLLLKGVEMSGDSVLREVLPDIDYYRNSGGGITLSGGEPMAQFDFTAELLFMSKEKGLHTCIETCGFVPVHHYFEILPYVDLFLFDYKATGSEKHKELTGVTNEKILGNLDFLYRQGVSIILRCPLIPEVNDSDDHLKAIAEINAKYPRLSGIELVPYHNMGAGKAKMYGRQQAYAELKTTDDDTIQKWLDKIIGYGCIKTRIA